MTSVFSYSVHRAQLTGLRREGKDMGIRAFASKPILTRAMAETARRVLDEK